MDQVFTQLNEANEIYICPNKFRRETSADQASIHLIIPKESWEKVYLLSKYVFGLLVMISKGITFLEIG